MGFSCKFSPKPIHWIDVHSPKINGKSLGTWTLPGRHPIFSSLVPPNKKKRVALTIAAIATPKERFKSSPSPIQKWWSIKIIPKLSVSGVFLLEESPKKIWLSSRLPWPSHGFRFTRHDTPVSGSRTSPPHGARWCGSPLKASWGVG